MEGFNKGTFKLGMKSGYSQLFFDNVKVPKENRLGDEKMGFKIMMEELARERLTVGSAVATEGAINTVIYTTERGF
jgi:alkylation response protein AidB-like acyl-CoA dehydrogenase